MTHPIVHIEFSANNHAEAAQWYANLFGWRVNAMPGMDYSTGAWAESDQAMGAGFNQVGDGVPAGIIVPYIMVEDLETYMARIVEAGGTIVMGRVDTPTVGAWCWFRDPTGNTVGCLQPAMQ